VKTFLLLLLLSLPAAADVLARIAKIESNNNDRAKGSSGEVSRYQFMPYVWHSYSSSKAYTNQVISRAVAEKHLQWIKKSWPLKRKITEVDIIVIWNKGLAGYKRQNYTPTKADKNRIPHAP
jgi:hypothetical protein